MKAPKWFVVGVGLVLLNFVAVTATVLSQQSIKEDPVGGTELQPDQLPNGVKAEVSDEAPPSLPISPAVPKDPVYSADTPPSLSAETAAPEKSLPVPEITLPQTPPENDPVYQGIREMIAEGMGNGDSPLTGMTQESQPSLPGIGETRLRIEAVQRLNDAVLCLLEEAEMHQNRGRESAAKNVLSAAQKLRAQAAKLLSSN